MENEVKVTRHKLVILYVSMILTVIVAVMFSIWTADQAVENALAARRAASIEAMRPTCDYILAQIKVYEATPPTTETGKQLKIATEAIYDQFKCAEIPPKP